MGALALTYTRDPKREEMLQYLGGENSYWVKNDVWKGDTPAFGENGIIVAAKAKHYTIADFTEFRDKCLCLEMKYFIFEILKKGRIRARSCSSRYLRAMRLLGRKMTEAGICIDGAPEGSQEIEKDLLNNTERNVYAGLKRCVIRAITELYDDRSELERDKWHALLIPGVKISAAAKRQKPSMSFDGIPEYYKPDVKRYMKNLIYRRSWSFCTEILVYLRFFYRSFYEHGYRDGFQEELKRNDIEVYLGWVAEHYEGSNATFRSKAVSLVRGYLDFIQLAEFKTAPAKDITRLILEEDIPKRERAADTLEKVKYIPEPVRNELDAAIDEIEPAEMKPVYILLRETGWRGTDILNLRYDQCLDYVWNSRSQEYVPYLYDEITKTGIPIHKIPIRTEVAEMVSKLIREVKERSTDENNPDRYLFNTFEGRCMGLPYSKPAFAAAVQDLINRKDIRDGDGSLYHFKTHSLRHTRAMEYTEQGMPIGIIQQILGHCSLQMTLHYAKVTEDTLYQKWKETEKLNLFKPDAAPPGKRKDTPAGVCYERVRKNLDAVKVPFGVCFKPAKISCKSQMKMCLECSSFCSTMENLAEYEAEIKRVREQIRIGEILGRPEWSEKNTAYLDTLMEVRGQILKESVVHKNAALREA